MKKCVNVILFLMTLAISARAQNKNFVVIRSGDSERDIVKKAPDVRPSPRQLRWQQLELTAFFHFGINTFTNEQRGDGKEVIARFNSRKPDAGQWVKTVKEMFFNS
ncbi:hypothetical protein [Mucilaginibacter sp. FT3.2]|uniref:hypothetical protein n=1 Tax=Mucilaginibacter sp. FT3.2 TaxID=2723090 RepID=UPI00160B88E3|nr:hypothetical protein [Mucilaginibacter sp. FT3.2]MBB6234941.1 hypothetical protein [Mucilaginibacter sp. FT3.2]